MKSETTPLAATKPMADSVYDSLKESIIAGSLSPGAPLRQDEIARSFGVSKVPVREALLKLEVDGFVQFRKNRGAIVRHLSSAEILQILDIRIALECRALELALPNMIDRDFAAAREILTTYSRETNSEGWSELNIRFHETLYEPSGNPQLLQLIADMQQRIGPYLRKFVSQAAGLERPAREHDQILDACQRGEAAEAVALLRAHIETTKKETAASLRRQEGHDS
ncbi:GntR family transcriptional regulator [Roseovarius sp. SCSIO 43702]|uniref:GntR family transcriptional regulator n=1 Tax=Roseovarius sp. SCSIO 43702 TaxID=2823043 RepID=UPI001C732257|nr:GntR family transcriptional regulator [Roseovarius sp. SCSIO 43702]QYX56858.1 GntR family transcriptional regulator [Roseovarius sp. SCSIO 43702]